MYGLRAEQTATPPHNEPMQPKDHFGALVNGVFTEESRQQYVRIIEGSRAGV